MKYYPSHHKSQTSVMILTRNEAMRVMLRVFLRGAGYQVSAAESKRQARALLHDLRPDVVVIDYESLHFEPEASKQLYEETRSLNIPVVALTGREPASEAHNVHADVYLPKPLYMDHLLKAITDLTH